MIYTLSHTFFLPILCIVISTFLLLLTGLILIFRFFSYPSSNTVKTEPILSLPAKEVEEQFNISSKDLSAIAGEDILTTQLDLARAYLETGRKSLAIKILKRVSEHGNETQKQAAHLLLSSFTEAKCTQGKESLSKKDPDTKFSFKYDLQ